MHQHLASQNVRPAFARASSPTFAGDVEARASNQRTRSAFALARAQAALCLPICETMPPQPLIALCSSAPAQLVHHVMQTHLLLQPQLQQVIHCMLQFNPML